MSRADSVFNLWLVAWAIFIPLALWIKLGNEPPSRKPQPAVPAHRASAPSAAVVPLQNGGGSIARTPELRTAPAAPVNRQPIQTADAVSPTQTLYLCKAYGGGAFWSTALCSTQRALMDRAVSVPRSLSFSEQVAMAQGEADRAAALTAPAMAPATAAGSISGGRLGPIFVGRMFGTCRAHQAARRDSTSAAAWFGSRSDTGRANARAR